MSDSVQLVAAGAQSPDFEMRLAAAERAIAEAIDLDQIKIIRDQAEALRAYAKNAKTTLNLQNRVASIKVKAERRAGQILVEMAERGERAGGYGGDRHSSRGLRLNDFSITKSQSSRWQVLAKLSDAAFNAEVQRVLDLGKELTTAGLLRFAKQLEIKRRNAELQTFESPTRAVERLSGIGVFRTLYTDPPWDLENSGTRAAAKNHYPTMDVDEIAAMNIAQLADDPCHLHLAVPFCLLPEGLRVMDAWGFEYKTALVWAKGRIAEGGVVPQIGLGNYWRTASELILFGTRGKTTFLDNSVPNWFLAEALRHSEKPAALRQLIERVSPPPRIELFARGKPAPGWTAWGNQVDAS